MFNPADWAAVPFHFWSVVVFVFGTIVGSFLNVCIHRMPLEQSVVSPPSHCPKCQDRIPSYLNIPIIAWLVLKGRCRKCREPISIRYLLVEAATGLMFLITWLILGPEYPARAIVVMLVIAGLIVATLIDLEHLIIPDEITIGGIVAGFLLSGLVPSLHAAESRTDSMISSAVGIAVGGGILYLTVRLGKLAFGRQRVKLEARCKVVFTETALVMPDETIPYEELFYRKTDRILFKGEEIVVGEDRFEKANVSLSPVLLKIGDRKYSPDKVPRFEAWTSELVLPREAMGFGDVKFLAAIGAFIGASGVFFVLLASSVIGSAIGLLGILSKRYEWSGKIPFGPYLALATLVWLWSPLLIQPWWQSYVGNLKMLIQSLL